MKNWVKNSLRFMFSTLRHRKIATSPIWTYLFVKSGVKRFLLYISSLKCRKPNYIAFINYHKFAKIG